MTTTKPGCWVCTFESLSDCGEAGLFCDRCGVGQKGARELTAEEKEEVDTLLRLTSTVLGALEAR